MIWDIDPVLADLGNGMQVRYYSLLTLMSLGLGTVSLSHYARRAGVPLAHGATFAAIAVAWVLAHVTHLVFYEPSGLADASRVFALGSGSASHGAFLGALVTFYLGTRTSREGPWVHLDLAMSGAVAMIPLWRLGNLLNSEIVGTPWDGPWAFVFVRHDCFDVARDACTAPPRHPTVLYEALLGAGLVALAAWLQHVWRPRLRPGVIFAILLSATFGGRMLVELTRERQGADAGWPVTIGFLLSLPFALAGAGLLAGWRGHLRAGAGAASR